VRKVPLLTLIAVVLLASVSLIHSQTEGAAIVNGHIEPAGSLESGQRATLVLDLSTSSVFDNEYVDEDGKFLFEVKGTLRLVGQSEIEPMDFGQGGISIAPKTDHFPLRVEIPQELTVGKWVVNATVYQQMLHDRMVVDMNPDRWPFDVFAKSPEKGIVQQFMESTYGIPAMIIAGMFATVFGVWYSNKRSKRSKREPHEQDPNRPVFHWEWFEEQVQRSTDKVAKIRIILRENHAARARVFVEGTQLIWERSGNKEFNMTAGNAGNLIIPPHLVSLDSKVSLRWGKTFSMNATIREIPKVNG
jgi:hypothetical protein